ncbi:MAG TPA: DUF559 domain-containing protein [Mycobacteriales bacterium]|nr:DUF559 domain-containing protein [Mycobacteriales bacterium]
MIDFQKPFIGSFAVAEGLVGRGALRGPRFVRLFPDIYVRADVRPTLRTRSEAARLLIGDTAVLSGYSAADFLGADCAPYHADAEITTLRHVRPYPGLLIHREHLEDDEVVAIRGHSVTSPVRTAFDLARRMSLMDAVATVDSLARVGGFDRVELIDLVGRHRGARWKQRIPACIDLIDPASESMMESRLRVTLVVRGLPRPVSQYSIFDAEGWFVARLDLAYPWAKLGIEYDGAHHLSRASQRSDLRRHNELLALGWQVLRFTADDIYRHPDETAAAVRCALHALKAS